MKKLLAFFFLYFVFTFDSVHAVDMVYSNASAGYDLYKKNLEDTANGSAITTGTTAVEPVYSPDGLYIVYRAFGPNVLYRKNATDVSDGTAVTTDTALDPVYSPDGQYIVYQNTTDGNKLYRKNANDVSNGTAITTVGATMPAYSPDGQYIIFEYGGFLYRKNANDVSDGTAITTSTFSSYGYPSYSPDGQYIIYGDGGVIYRKNANDVSDGTAITTGTSSNSPAYSPDGQFIVYKNTSTYLIYRKDANDVSNGSAITSDVTAVQGRIAFVYTSATACDPAFDPSCYCTTEYHPSATDFTYYPYSYSGSGVTKVVTGAFDNVLEIRPPGYSFFTAPDLLGRFTYANADTDSDLDGGWYPDSMFSGTGGTYDTTGVLDSLNETRLTFRSYYYGTGSAYMYVGTGVVVANPDTNAFDYFKLHGLNSDTVDVRYSSIEQDYNGVEYTEEKTVYSVRTDEYIRLPRATRSIVIVLKQDRFYYIPTIEVGYHVPGIDEATYCNYVSPEDIANISITGADGVGISLALNNLVKQQQEQDALNAFKFENPILDGVYQKVLQLLNKLGLNNLMELLKIVVPDEPPTTMPFPIVTVTGGLVGVEEGVLAIDAMENLYDVNGLLPESVYQPYFIGIVCTAIWIGFLYFIIWIVFLGNSVLIGLVDTIVTRFFGSSVLDSSGGNIFSLFTTASWLLLLGKTIVTVLSFINFVLPVITLALSILLGFITFVTINLGGYSTFQTLSNFIVGFVILGVFAYAMMLAGRAYLKLN